MKYKQEIDRRLSVKAYILLCEGLEAKYGINEKPLLGYAAKGKPFLIGYPDIHFNMSHCNEAVLCAIDDRPVGVDVECVKEYNEDLARYVMNAQEMEQINGSARPDIEFTRLWTMKEAVLKCSGAGIANNMKDVLVGCRRNLKTFVSQNEGYVYSVCM